MNFKWIGRCLCLAMSALSLSGAAQNKDSIVFLGDTLSLSSKQIQYWKTKSDDKLIPLANETDKFIVHKTGTLSFQDQRFHIADPLDDGVTKILVIGNSFSDDGVEYYLHDLAKQSGKPLIIGNLFRGGAPLDFHLKNATENNAIYDYRKTYIDGAKVNTRKTSILTALKDENWDIICFQQASLLSGDLASVKKDLPLLFAYVQKNYPISSVRYAYHQTWAYAQNASTKNFEKYNRNQELMYQKIVDVSKEIKNIIPIDFIVPTGTAIQNGRTSYVGDNFTREGYHLDLKIGRFTAACTWYQSLFHDLNQESYVPFNLSRNQIDVARNAAIAAVDNPFEITTIENLKLAVQPNSFSPIQVNFGADLIMSGWNSFLFERADTRLSDLNDCHNRPTSVAIELIRNFDKRAIEGPARTAIDFKMPAEVSQSNFSVQLTEQDASRPFLRINGLDPKKKYTVAIFASQNQQVNPLYYWVSGSNARSELLNTSFNKNRLLTFENLTPRMDGSLEIGFKQASKTLTSTAIINALRISEKNEL